VSPPSPSSAPVPYTTLFRSVGVVAHCHDREPLRIDLAIATAIPDLSFPVALIEQIVPHVAIIAGALAAGAPAIIATCGTICSIRDRKSTRLNSSHVKISYAV